MKDRRRILNVAVVWVAVWLAGISVWPLAAQAQSSAATLEVAFDCHSYRIDGAVRKALDGYAARAEEHLAEKPGLSRRADSGELAASVGAQRRPALVIRTRELSKNEQKEGATTEGPARISVVVTAAHHRFVEKRGEMPAGGEALEASLAALIDQALEEASVPAPQAASPAAQPPPGSVAAEPRLQQAHRQAPHQVASQRLSASSSARNRGGDSTLFWIGLGAFSVTYAATIIVGDEYMGFNPNAMSRMWVPIVGPQMAKSYVSDRHLENGSSLGTTLSTIGQAASFAIMVGGGIKWWSSSRTADSAAGVSAKEPSQTRFWTTGNRVGMEVSW